MPESVSGLSSYCTAAQFVERYDWRTVGQLLTDGGPVPASSAAVEGDVKLGKLLKQASGKLEAAALAGGRYTVADLQELVGSNQGEFLAGLVADLTIGLVYRRRPDMTTEAPPQADEADNLLEALARGEKLFGLRAAVDASVLASERDEPADVEARQDVSYLAKNFFGTRSKRIPR